MMYLVWIINSEGNSTRMEPVLGLGWLREDATRRDAEGFCRDKQRSLRSSHFLTPCIIILNILLFICDKTCYFRVCNVLASSGKVLEN